MFRTRVLLGAAALAGLALSVGPAAAQDSGKLEILTGLTVRGGARLEGTGVVRSGVPLPLDLDVRDPSTLGIARGDGTDPSRLDPVPVQWHVASRGGGLPSDTTKPIRWAIANFEARAGDKLVLVRGPGASRSAGLGQIGTETDAGVVVDTGAVRFSVPRDRFAPLSGFTRRVADAAGRETVLEPLAASGLDVVMVNAEPEDPEREETAVVDRTYRLSWGAPDIVRLEENGPVRAVVLVRGRFAAQDGTPLLKGFIGYTLRITADRGSGLVNTTFTLENNGQYGPPSEPSISRSTPKWLHIRRLDLEVPLALRGNVRGVTTDGEFAVSGGAAATDLRLLQLHRVRVKDDESRNFEYTVSVDGRQVASGDRSDGTFGVRSDSGAVVATMRHFWQNYPKAMSLDSGVMRFELWPQEPGQRWPPDEGDLDPRWGDAYRFEGGRHKTYTCGLYFDGAVGSDDARVLARSVEEILVLRVDPGWVARTGALGPLAPVDFPVRNGALQTSLRHLARMQIGLVDVSYADPQGPGDEVPPASLITQRERRGHANPAVPYDMDYYGWMNFGDLTDGNGYVSGHYDWLRGLFMNFLRHGNEEFLEVALQMMKHRYDIDQFHGQERVDPNWSWYNGLQRADAGRHGQWNAKFHPHGEWTPAPQRTWLEGLVMGYLITGDPKALDCARENAEAFYNYYTHATGRLDPKVKEPLVYYGQLSSLANSMGELLAFYEFTGEDKYLRAARLLFEDGVLYAEEYLGNRGFWGIEGEKQALFPIVRLMRPLIQMHQVTGDDRALALLLRILRWVETDAYDGSGRLIQGRYMPLQLPYFWVKRGESGHGDRWYIPYNFFTADAYAYAYRQTGAEQYLTFARELFRDSVLFYQAPMHQAIPPGFYSEVSYVPRQYPGSETKTGVWSLTGHQWYLLTEFELSARETAPIELRHDVFFTDIEEIARRGRAYTDRVGSRDTTAPDYQALDVRVESIVPEERGVRVVVRTSVDTEIVAEYRLAGSSDAWRALQASSGAGAGLRSYHELPFLGLEPETAYEGQITARDARDQRHRSCSARRVPGRSSSRRSAAPGATRSRRRRSPCAPRIRVRRCGRASPRWPPACRRSSCTSGTHASPVRGTTIARRPLSTASRSSSPTRRSTRPPRSRSTRRRRATTTCTCTGAARWAPRSARGSRCATRTASPSCASTRAMWRGAGATSASSARHPGSRS